MLLTITTTHQPATDLGYLLHKNPGRVHESALSFGRAVMFFPDAQAERSTFALLLDIDPVALVRGRSRDAQGLYDQYVSDRPYVASSFLSVAIAKGLRNALGGSSKERPELAATAIPLEARVLPLPVRGAEDLVDRLFAPLGYEVGIEPIALDEKLSYLGEGWDQSPYVMLNLAGTMRLCDLLSHLYVLVPVLDKHKHYFVDRHELEKLVSKGESWLGVHPEKELIARRYLRFKRSWAREALARLAVEEAIVDANAEAVALPEGAAGRPRDSEEEPGEAPKDAAEEALEKPIRLHELRLDTVAGILKNLGARRIVDLGCGSGKLLKRLLVERQFKEIVGIDVSSMSLEIAARRVRLETMTERQRARIKILHGALTYRDRRIEGYDAAALVEVVEHLDPDRLAALERALFEFAKPEHAIVTTPNREYNVKFQGMAPGQLRHADHRFEWTREEFAAWVETVGQRFGYGAEIKGIGDEDPVVGAPSQIAVFSRV
jgi:3' terminal RNA ribose 2'-O-methyltransferase Hen1